MPFKDAKLPPNNPRNHNRFLQQQPRSALLSGGAAGTSLESTYRSGSMDIQRSGLTQWDSGLLSPELPSRPMSPDGLGTGIYSSAFLDTGVEGLIYSGSNPDLQEMRCAAAVCFYALLFLL